MSDADPDEDPDWFDDYNYPDLEGVTGSLLPGLEIDVSTSGSASETVGRVERSVRHFGTRRQVT